MNKLFFAACVLFISSVSLAQAQEPRIYTLQDVVGIAQINSPFSRQAETLLENQYWQYRNFRSNFLPQIVLDGTLPNFNRSILPITQPDGSQLFRGVSQSIGSLGVGIRQNIGLTGGQVFLNSQVQRIDNFAPISGVSYSANPAVFGFIQPLFNFNPFIWEKRIEPLRYEESRRGYREEMERISLQATDLYFNLLLAQISEEIAERNVANNDTLYKISEGRFNLGKIAENELLQLELSLMNARQNLAQAKLDKETTALRLKVFLGFVDNDPISLLVPDRLSKFQVDTEKAVAEAKKNSSRVISFLREKSEADREMARAKGETGLNANLFASFGLNQQAGTIPELYINPQDQQRVQIGFQIPIMDWGRTKSRLATASANQRLVYSNVEQDEINFVQEVYLQSKQFTFIRGQLEVAQKSDEIAEKRYEIAKNRYLIGKIGITDLNIANNEKDEAKRNFVAALRNYWTAYYNLRLLTLYDFENNISLVDTYELKEFD